jgi:hypothetical protein
MGQTTSGTILGVLTDPQGAVIPNTPIVLTNVATGATFRAQTNAAGLYQFFNVPPNRYDISVQRPGFVRLRQGPYKVQVGASLRIDLKMRLGSDTQTVTVTAQTPLVQAETSSLGDVVDERETNDLPLNGRNPMNLTELVPSVVPQGGAGGTTNSTNPFAWGNYQIGGGIANQSETFIDGAPVNTIYDNLTSLVPSQDSLSEFKVYTNSLPAEYGHTAGGAIQFSTKSGTNVLHGTLWEYLRNKVLNANTWFDNHEGIPRGSFTQNQFGFNGGGPVVIPHLYNGRNRTFFFFNWEGFSLRQGQTFTETVPTAAELAGNMNLLPKVENSSGQLVEPTIYDPLTTCTNPSGCAGDPTKGAKYGERLPFPNNQIPAGRINQAALNYLKRFYPISTVGTNNAYANFTANAPIGGQNYQAVAKIDEQVSENQHISSRYTWWQNTNLPQDPMGTGICQDRCTENFTTYNWVLDDSYTFNPTTLLDMRVSYLRFEYTRRPEITDFNPSSIGQTLGDGAAPEFAVPPIVSIAGFDIDGTFASEGASSIISDASDDDRIAGTLTKILGKHTLHIGGEFRRDTFNFYQDNAADGNYTATTGFTDNNDSAGMTLPATGAGLATFLLGYTNSGSYDTVAPTASELLYPALFATDDWRVSKKLTLHMGLRWENNLPYTERHNNISYFDPTQVNPVLAAAGLGSYVGSTEVVDSSTRHQRSGIDTDKAQFSPRFGLNYAVGPKTVVSAGYGILWVPMDVDLISAPAYDSINSQTTSVVESADGGVSPSSTTNFSNPLPNGINQPPQRSTNPKTGFQYSLLGQYLYENDPKNPYPYAQQWNLEIQQQLGSQSMFSIAYAGSKGTHLPFFALPIDVLPEKYFNAASLPYLEGFTLNPFCGVESASSIVGGICPYTYNELMAKPYPQYYQVLTTAADRGDSTYNSLQVTAQRRFANGASINAAYTFAKLIDSTDTLTSWLESSESDAYGAVADPNNLGLEKSISSSDVKHRLVISYVYDLPIGQGKAILGHIGRPMNELAGGWSLEGITTFQSGFPVSMISPVNENAFYGNGGYGAQRAAVVPGCDRTRRTGGPIGSRTFFNTSCYKQAPAFTWGESRNDPVVRAPGIDNWDTSVVKNFSIGKDSRYSAEFRTEFFNVWNRTQFGTPNGVIGTSTTGTVTSQANEPRLIQFAMRINY